MSNWLAEWWDSKHPTPQNNAPSGPPAVLDLAANPQLTAMLIGNTDIWRVRAVEQVDLTSALFCRAQRSLQVAPLEELLKQFTGDDAVPDRVRLVLPVETLPKRPLLNFDLTGPGDCPAFLVKRREIAERERRFIEVLASDEGVPVPNELLELVTAICEFTPGPWNRSRRRVQLQGRRLRKYLSDAMGFGVDKALLRQWQEPAGRIRSLVQDALNEGKDDTSSSENPLLALPLLLEHGLGGPHGVLPLLEQLATWMEDLAESAGSAIDSSALVTIAEYGRRWEVLAECTVPTREPFVFHMAEDRPLKVSRFFNISEQTMLFGDAPSNHILLRVTDPNVEFGRHFEPRDITGQEVGSSTFTGVRESREAFAAYGSDANRDFHVSIRFRLRRPTSASFATLTIEIITWLALAIAISQRHHLGSGDLAVVAVPTTFAASVLLTRERTSLAGRIQWFSRLRVTCAVLALWGWIGYLYFGHHLEPTQSSVPAAQPPGSHTPTIGSPIVVSGILPRP